MRSHQFLLLGLVLLCFLEIATAARLPFNARQDSEVPATTSVDPSLKPSSATNSEEPTSEPTSDTAQSSRSIETVITSTSRSPSSVPSSTTTKVTVTFASNGSKPSSTSGPQSENPLPIHPKITPAMGLAGAILLISGAVYTVIGIKKNWLYVFFSAAYLTSLAVAVLIVYLMSAPVSDAVQGGFFVAAVLTGLLFGGLSLVFSDLTEGLGCLLGGFCLSMWFLTLREGGLIRSTTGRAIFIACMSVAVYFLSFSHYTRTYGLIGSISFAGATITMLGIDCFSRAGLKEFWLYIWGLNDDIFPLFTDTYPLTRALKVEIACIVLLTVFGVISQVKLWRIVRERREKKTVTRLERDRDLQHEEEEVGRRIHNKTTRERAQWEAIYGDNTQNRDSVTESSQKSSAKTSMSIQEKDGFSSDSVEMTDLPSKQTGALRGHTLSSASKHASTGPPVMVTAVPEEDETEYQTGNGQRSGSMSNGPIGRTGPFDATANSARVSSDIAVSGETRSSIRSSVSPAPVVVPLPFRVPTVDYAGNEEEDHASISVMAESVSEAAPKRSLSERASGAWLSKRLSARRTSPDGLEEGLIVPHVEDDRASSLAATLDEDYDKVSLANLSAPPSPSQSAFGQRAEELASDTQIPTTGSRSPDTVDAPSDESPLSMSSVGDPMSRVSLSDSRTSLSLTVSTDPMPKDNNANRASLGSPRLQHTANISTVDEVEEDDEHTKALEPTPHSPTSQTLSPVGLSKEALPGKLSKVALSYRTNEWAKHLEDAEEPEVGELSEPGSPGVKLSNSPVERPAPVHDDIIGIQPAKPQPKRTSTGSKPYRTSNLMRSTSDMPRGTLIDAPVGVAQGKGNRSSSTPFPSQTLHSAAAMRLSNTPSPTPGNTLLGQRESFTRNKYSSSSLTPLSSSQNLLSRVSNTPSPSLTPLSSSPNLLSDLDQENMTLAQRKQLIKQQKPPSASQQWRQSSQAIQEQVPEFDAHQPKRSSGAVDANKREIVLAGWRESVRQEGIMAPNATPVDVEKARRAAMINEKRQREIAKQEQALKAQQRESMMDNAMRSSQMLEAHREAMRRMQAKANRNA